MPEVITPKLKVDGYEDREVISVNYQFHQQIDVEGQPTSTTRGGILTIKLKSTDSGNTDLLDWVCDSYLAKNGTITWPRRDGSTMKTLAFTDAYCVGFEEAFDATNSELQNEVITITCRQLTVTGKGSVQYDNHWAL